MSSVPHTLPYVDPKATRRTALITAGNSGVGWQLVLQLYLHGYVVYLAGRSKSRCAKLILELQAEAHAVRATYTSHERSTRFLGELHYLEIDLTSLASVCGAVAAFRNLEKSLSLLINNAGVAVLPYKITPDGFELQLQTNYVAPFLLTTKLLPLLERSAELPSADAPRVIYISSVSHRLVLHNLSLSTRLNYSPNFLFTWFRYAVAKNAGIHFMKMLALRNPRILCVSVQPGFIMNANYFSYWTRLPLIGIVFWCMFQLFGFFFGVNVHQAAEAILQCAIDPAITPETDNGGHFTSRGKSSPAKVARNMDYAARTWIWTIHQLGKRNIDIS